MNHDGDMCTPSSSGKVFVVGVCGGSGSGKTTISAKIKAELGKDCAYLCHDMYYRDQTAKSMEARVRTNYDHPHSLETELMTAHLRELKAGRAVLVPEYDFDVHTRKGGLNWQQTSGQKIQPASVVLVEGILLFENEAMRDEIDLRIFVECDADLRFIRRMERDILPTTEGGRGRKIADVVTQYIETVRPMHNLFVEPSKHFSHIILPYDQWNPSGDGAILRAIIREVTGE